MAQNYVKSLKLRNTSLMPHNSHLPVVVVVVEAVVAVLLLLDEVAVLLDAVEDVEQVHLHQNPHQIPSWQRLLENDKLVVVVEEDPNLQKLVVAMALIVVVVVVPVLVDRLPLLQRNRLQHRLPLLPRNPVLLHLLQNQHQLMNLHQQQ